MFYKCVILLCDLDTLAACASEPCQFGGTCTNGEGDDYTCTCTDGYTGQNCEDKIPRKIFLCAEFEDY